MIQYLIRRVFWAIALMFTVTAIGFALFYLVPKDPARVACGKSCTPVMLKRISHDLGTDRPLYVQYAKFVGKLIPFSFTGGPHFKYPNLGHSYFSQQSVNQIITQAAPITMSLVFGAVILWMLVALPIGILSALRPRSLLDRTTMFGVLVGVSMHPVWLGLLLLYFLSDRVQLFPIGGYAGLFSSGGVEGQSTGLVQWAYHLALPWFTLAVLFMAIYVRMIRANVMEVMSEDYVRTARAKGAPESRVLRQHILRNALLPVVTMLGMDIGLALGGAVFTESIYGLQGLGWWTVQSITAGDTPTVLGVIVFATTMIIVFNLIVDVLYAWIDPRIRLS
ncbi:MAG TPA: ABC transporter permease [Gaiellaceae bacterium]|jgi:peptide/nickel transport system permease protein